MVAIVKCKECKADISNKAAACLSCGAPLPKGSTVGAWLMLLALVFVIVQCTRSLANKDTATPAASKSTTPAAPVTPSTTYVPPGPSPQDLAIQRARERLRQQHPAETQRELAELLVELCRQENPHLNDIQPLISKASNGVAIYCRHDFFTRYTFASGSLSGEVSRFVENWSDELRAARVQRVGVWGTGDYASGVWYDVPK